MLEVNTSRLLPFSRFAMISPKAKMPMATTTKLIPSVSSGTPKV